MLRPGIIMFGLCGVCVFATSLMAGAQGPDPQGQALPIDRIARMQQFLGDHPGCGFSYLGNRIERVYGPAFSNGNSAEQSADQFRIDNAGIWGVLPADLLPVAHYEGGQHLQPIMYQPESGQYKFTGVNYSQARDGVPVFRGRLTLLVRNEPGYPLVLASADVHDLGAFHVGAGEAANVNSKAGFQAVQHVVSPQVQVVAGPTVIWAGVDDTLAQPTLATQFIAEGGNPALGTYQKTLFLTDASTGAILYQESLINDVNVSGNVSGMATTGWGADACAPSALMPLPYAYVAIGATTAFTDINGNYTIPNAGSSQVTVTSSIKGNFFNVFNPGNVPATSLTQNVTPPGPANFIHNQADTSETNRAEVNAYIHANVVHDFCLAQNPAYPVISGQSGPTAFPVNVNIALTCNAFYDGSSINFYMSGGSCTNTANSTVVHHEYGHHIVASGGSGQGAYGEGMGDTMGVLISDQPCLGAGFSTSIETTPCSVGPATCASCLRSADNTSQYQVSGCSSCGSEIHACGRLISGCVWSTRNNLQANYPATYLQILRSLVVNSVLLHSGSSITPSITIDYLTLDDDNGDISDGTPHYVEINGGFSAHSMPGPALAALKFTYPNGKPTYVSPAGGTTMQVVVSGITGTPQPNTGKLFVDTGSGFVQTNMTQGAPNVYTATFPASTCGSTVKYYVSAQTTTAEVVTSPGGAPGTFFNAISAVGAGPIVFNDDFQTDKGWTTAINGATAGAWQRAVPVTDCNRGNPTVDADGSGMCYVTQNDYAAPPDQCNTDVDGGSVILTSPIMNASQGAPVLSYWRWYSNTVGADPENDVFVIEFSTNGGGSWLPLETVGPNSGSPNPQVNGGWFQRSFSLNSIPGFVPTTQFKVRFNASDLGLGSVVEAGVDGVKLTILNCTNPCSADINHDNVVNVSDLLTVINAWGPCTGCPADINGDGNVNSSDLLGVINSWGACP